MSNLAALTFWVHTTYYKILVNITSLTNIFEVIVRRVTYLLVQPISFFVRCTIYVMPRNFKALLLYWFCIVSSRLSREIKENSISLFLCIWCQEWLLGKWKRLPKTTVSGECLTVCIFNREMWICWVGFRSVAASGLPWSSFVPPAPFFCQPPMLPANWQETGSFLLRVRHFPLALPPQQLFFASFPLRTE